MGEQFPIPFSIDYYPEDIDPNGTYVLQAELKRFRGRACQGLYRHKEVYEVITRDSPTHDIQLEIVQVDKKGSEEVAHLTGSVAYANPYEDVESDSSSDVGNTDPDSEDDDTDPNSEEGDTNPNSGYGDTDPRRVESDEEVSGTVSLIQLTPTLAFRPEPNPDIPWHLSIMDLTKDCTLAEVPIRWQHSATLQLLHSILFLSC